MPSVALTGSCTFEMKSSSAVDSPCISGAFAGGKPLTGPKGGMGAVTWTALHKTVLAKLPMYMQLQLPITFTRRAAIDRAMLDRLTDSILRGSSFTGGADSIREDCKRRELRLQQEYLHFQLFKQGGQTPALLPQSEPGVSRAGNSSKHLDISTSFQPSRQYLSTVWLEAMRPSIDWANRYLSTIKGRFWCMDHTFATAKRVRDASQQPVYKAVLTVVNEYCQEVAQWFTHTTSLLELRSGLEKLKERYKDDSVQVMLIPIFF